MSASRPHGLERLLGMGAGSSGGFALEVGAPGSQAPTLLTQRDWRVYATLRQHDGAISTEFARFELENGPDATVGLTADGHFLAPFSFEEAYENYISERWVWVRQRRPSLPAWQLDTFYRIKRFLPRRSQLAARRLLIRWQGLPEFPRWPLDTSVSRLARLYAFCRLTSEGRTEAPMNWFWPDGHDAALILTHDVETGEGLRLAVDLADREEELGFRSSFNLGAWYDPDPGIIRDLTGRGFEIGCHALRHDRSLFASRDAFESQLPLLADFAARLGAEGFRSPATYREFDWLARLPVSYDCSIPNSDPYEPQPGGCGSVWPFFVGNVVELPYTLPQDHTLFTLLRHDAPTLWLEQVERIERENGLVQCVSHPDRGYLGDPDKRRVYLDFLTELQQRANLWKVLPREVASWWRRRDDAIASGEVVATGTIRIGSSPDSVVFARGSSR